MTIYTFVAKSSTPYVNWSNPSIWSGGIVPNDPNADVVIPNTNYASSNEPFYSTIESTGVYSIASLSIADNTINVDSGQLSISGALSLQSGGEISLGSAVTITQTAPSTYTISAGGPDTGTLNVASCENDGEINGSGSFSCSGLLNNEYALGGGNLTVSAGKLQNTGELSAASGTTTITVTPGGFANLAGSTLTGGAYAAGGSSTAATLDMNVGGIVSTDAANIILEQNGDIKFYNSSQSTYTPIETSLQTISATGRLVLESDTPSFGNLSVDGSLLLQDAQPTFSRLTLNPQGEMIGRGAVNGPIIDNGAVEAGNSPLAPWVYDTDPTGGKLEIAGPVTGSGSLKIGPAGQDTTGGLGAPPSYSHWTLQLDAATSTNVEFLDGNGILVLNDPSGFTGEIAPTWSKYGSGDQIQLADISLNSVKSYSYSGDGNGGVLQLNLGKSEYDLHLIGDFITADFSLSAGPQVLTTDPPSLDITINATPVTTLDQAKDDPGGSGASAASTSSTSTSGQLATSQVGAAGHETAAQRSTPAPEQTFGHAGNFLGGSHGGYALESSKGDVGGGETGSGGQVHATSNAIPPSDSVGGHIHYVEVGGLGSEWGFHS